MEYLIIIGLVAIGALVVWLFKQLEGEQRINEGHKVKIERLTDDKHALMRENDRLQARIDKIRPPFGGLLSELPELFTDEEFATRAQKAEADRAKGRRMTDRYEGPKPSLGWDEQDRQDFNGSGI